MVSIHGKELIPATVAGASFDGFSDFVALDQGFSYPSRGVF